MNDDGDELLKCLRELDAAPRWLLPYCQPSLLFKAPWWAKYGALRGAKDQFGVFLRKGYLVWGCAVRISPPDGDPTRVGRADILHGIDPRAPVSREDLIVAASRLREMSGTYQAHRRFATVARYLADPNVALLGLRLPTELWNIGPCALTRGLVVSDHLVNGELGQGCFPLLRRHGSDHVWILPHCFWSVPPASA